MEQIAFHAMGSQMLAVLAAEGAAAVESLASVPGWFAAWEQRLSRFRDDSELSRLNRSGGRRTRVSKLLWNVVQVSLGAARTSCGLFDPTLLNALEAAGYDRSFEALGPGQPPSGPVAVNRSPGWRAIACHRADRSVALPPGLRLDLGGIAKGWAADTAVRHLGAYGPALVDAGGDIAVNAPPAGEPGWPIAIADPDDSNRQIALLILPRGGVATSGRDYRRWQRGDVPYHHILDPRTGRPAETDVLTATVVAPSAQQAEVAAKVALILGSQAGAAWLEARPWLAGLLIGDDGRIVRTRRIEKYLWS